MFNVSVLVMTVLFHAFLFYLHLPSSTLNLMCFTWYYETLTRGDKMLNNQQRIMYILGM